MCAFNYAVVYVCFRRFGSGRLGVFPCNRIGAFAVRFCKNTAGVLGTYGCNRKKAAYFKKRHRQSY